MTKRAWRQGPPPHVGWWNASFMKDPYCWRWWDGERWSIGVSDFASPEFVTPYANKPATRDIQGLIEWTNYWPENARVPRIKP